MRASREEGRPYGDVLTGDSDDGAKAHVSLRGQAEPASAVDEFDLTGRVAVVCGGYGVLGSAIAADLGRAGVRVAVLGRRRKPAEEQAEEIRKAGGDAVVLLADVLDEPALQRARDELTAHWRAPDILVNAAGGNLACARNDGTSIFDVPMEAFDETVRLNLHGTVLPSLVFGRVMAERGTGSVVNISSMAALRVLSGVMAYSAAKAALENFTRWLAVELAQRHGEGLRVNAVAPGFFLSEQNRAVLVNQDGSFTDRARRIIEATPMGRLGRPDELTGAVRWLCSDASSFVTGVVVPVDGGFSAFSGV